MNIALSFIVRIAIFSILFLGCALTASFGLPWFFNLFEQFTNTPLSFEGALRLSILSIHALLLLVSLAWVIVRGNRIHWALWLAFCLSFLSLAGIFFGDRSHRLLEEYSWIRYTTASFLVLASLCGAWLFIRACRAEGFVHSSFWILLSGALLYAGLDEIFEIHEAIGRFLQRSFSMPETTTDFITIGYAAITIIAITIFIRARLLDRILSTYRIAALLFASGALVYTVSTLCDTLDVFVHAKLRSLANVLTADPTFVMSDAWYLVWSVKNSLNGFEEVFEHTAALLFLLALGSILFHSLLAQAARPTLSKFRIVGSVSIMTVCVIGTTSAILASLKTTFPKSVATQSDIRMVPIAGYFDGLFHADDLDYHPTQGVVLANEGRRSTYRFKNNVLQKIEDTQKLIQDPDSVSANETGVYVSDGNAGRVIHFHNGKEDSIADRSNGLVHPEGLVALGSDIYILDESQRSISHFSPGKKLEIWKPQHPDWKTPEGIAYDPTAKRFLVTDDTTGAIFRLNFGKTIEKIATLQNPEDIAIAKDGSVLITDTAWGAVFRLSPDGSMEKILQLNRMYRDIQGVAMDDKGILYIVTADGFGSTSFMPSFLFTIEGIIL